MAKNVNVEDFKLVTAKNYYDQAKFFLNAFWVEHSKDAETIWTYAQDIVKLDDKNGKNGCDLDEFNAHRFLEQHGETKRVVELRDTLREIDLDFNKRMALVEYLLFRFKQKVPELLSRPQGSNKEEMEKAQRKIKDAQDSLAKQQVAEKEAKETQKQLEMEQKKLNDKMSDLEKKTKEGTLVSKNKAIQELEALKKEDPLPLRKAKISQDAAVRKNAKLTKECLEAVKQAEEYLEQVKKLGGNADGDIWWMQREITEAKKYLPKSKQ